MSRKQRRFLALLVFAFSPAPLLAQDAHSLGIGGAATAAPMGMFGVYWNPALLALPTQDHSGWGLASGFSAFDTSNTGTPILKFSDANSLQSSADPIQRYQQYNGIFVAKYLTAAGGVDYDQEMNLLESQDALAFFHDRSGGNINALSPAYNNLNYQQTNQQVADLVLSYSMPFPLGALPFFSIGGSLKYHDGLYYQQTTLAGAYDPAVPGSGYQYTKTTSTSGLGLSIDAGFFAKLTDVLQVGMMFENIQTNFSWQAVRQNYTLDSGGNETPSGPPSNVTVQAPFPYATKLGFLAAPEDKNILLEAEVAWSQHQARWRFGMERFYPQSNLVVRFGTFADPVSNQQLWAFGFGYTRTFMNIDLSFVTRSLPAVQDSISLGGALDAEVRF